MHGKNCCGTYAHLHAPGSDLAKLVASPVPSSACPFRFDVHTGTQFSAADERGRFRRACERLLRHGEIHHQELEISPRT